MSLTNLFVILLANLILKIIKQQQQQKTKKTNKKNQKKPHPTG